MDDMKETKPAYLSRGVIGGVVAVGAVVAGLFGYEVDADTQAVVVDQGVAIATAVATVVGGVLAIWGRIKATKRIK